MTALQSAHGVLPPSDPLRPLQLQRLLALLSLLTQVTHTAGCHQELQAGMVRYRPIKPLRSLKAHSKQCCFDAVLTRYLLFMLQLGWSRVPPASSGVLGSRRRLAGILDGAFKGFYQEP